MKNAGIRYEPSGYIWIPEGSIDTFLRHDRYMKKYGKGRHFFLPKDYCIGE